MDALRRKPLWLCHKNRAFSIVSGEIRQFGKGIFLHSLWQCKYSQHFFNAIRGQSTAERHDINDFHSWTAWLVFNYNYNCYFSATYTLDQHHHRPIDDGREDRHETVQYQTVTKLLQILVQDTKDFSFQQIDFRCLFPSEYKTETIQVRPDNNARF